MGFTLYIYNIFIFKRQQLNSFTIIIGFVTTTRVPHATPAALYAHSANRDWECLIPEDVENSEDGKDIAWQLINESPGNKTKVILGGGFPAFYPRPEHMLKKSTEEVGFYFFADIKIY